MKLLRRGLSLTEALVTIALVALLTGLLLPAVQKVRGAASRAECLNNLHQIGLAVTDYREVQGRYPKPDDSWTAELLPYLEQGNLSSGYDPSLSIFDPINRPLGAVELRLFRCRADRAGRTDDGWAIGNVVGNGKVLGLGQVPDGASSTVFAYECPTAWGLAWFAGPVREVLDLADNRHTPVVPVLMCGGEARYLAATLPASVLSALLTPSGGEPVSVDGD